MLRNIKLKNFKTLKEIDCQLSALNVLTGVNGAGKSSFIQALLLLKQTFEDTRFSKRGLILNGPILKLGKGKDVLCDYAPDDAIDLELTWEDGTSLALNCSVDLESDLLKYKSKGKNIKRCVERLTKKEHCLLSQRIVPSVIYPASLLNVVYEDFLGYEGEYTAHYIAHHALDSLRIEGMRHAAAESNHFLMNVNKWIGEIAPNIRVHAVFSPSTDTVELGYIFENETGLSNIYKPTNVGYGITYVLPIIVAVLKSKPGELLIIENPETYLHPAGQSALGRLCALAAGNGVQICVETHSDHFINGVRVAVKRGDIDENATKILYFEKDNSNHGAKFQEIHVDSYGRLDNLPAGFCDEWDRQLDQLLI